MVESSSGTKKDSKNEVEQIELTNFGKIGQKASPFLNQKKSWDDDEDF